MSRALAVISLRILSLIALGGSPLHAQTDSAATPARRNWRLGGSLMLPTTENTDVSLTALSFTATGATPLRLGPDIAIAVMPRALQAGALLGGARLNLGVPIPLGRNVTLVPSAGLTLLGAIALGGAGGARGANGTLAMHVFSAPRDGPPAGIGLRLAVSQHSLGSDTSGSLRMVEIGLLWR